MTHTVRRNIMSHLRFTDGMSFDTGGPLRLTVRSDGMYVVGRGMLVPVRDEREGRQLIENITKTEGIERKSNAHT